MDNTKKKKSDKQDTATGSGLKTVGHKKRSKKRTMKVVSLMLPIRCKWTKNNAKDNLQKMKSGNMETITPTAMQKIIFKKSDLLGVDEALTGTTEKKNDDDVNDNGSEDNTHTGNDIDVSAVSWRRQTCKYRFDESISPTQEAILRYPEILGVDGTDQISEPFSDDPGNDNELSPTQEAILKFLEFFGVNIPVATKLHDDVDYKEIDAAVNTACILGSFGISELNDGDYVVMHDTNTETITDIPETMRLAEEMESKNTETQELISDNPDLLGVDEPKTVTIE